MQLELFQKIDLKDHWEKSLQTWKNDTWRYRHRRYTTGWSMATQGFLFARLLFKNGFMEKKEFQRYWKFNRRIQRWDKKP